MGQAQKKTRDKIIEEYIVAHDKKKAMENIIKKYHISKRRFYQILSEENIEPPSAYMNDKAKEEQKEIDIGLYNLIDLDEADEEIELGSIITINKNINKIKEALKELTGKEIVIDTNKVSKFIAYFENTTGVDWFNFALNQAIEYLREYEIEELQDYTTHVIKGKNGGTINFTKTPEETKSLEELHTASKQSLETEVNKFQELITKQVREVFENKMEAEQKELDVPELTRLEELNEISQSLIQEVLRDFGSFMASKRMPVPYQFLPYFNAMSQQAFTDIMGKIFRLFQIENERTVLQEKLEKKEELINEKLKDIPTELIFKKILEKNGV
jgi:hypothetical protein